MCALLIKNRPVRGGFLFSLVLRRPNSKLCRWYRTFFAILLRIPAFFGPKCGASSLADLIHCTWHPTNCTAWKLLKLGNAHGSVSELNVSCDWGGRRGSFRTFCLIASGTSELLFSDDDPVRYLVDPASSHTLVSKIKPCMSKYKLLYGETADGSLKQLLFT